MKKTYNKSFLIGGVTFIIGAAFLIMALMGVFQPKQTTSDEIIEVVSSVKEGEQEQVDKVAEMVDDDIACSGSVYYVDAVNGNDGNDGLSKESPFQTLRRVSSLVLEPGDRVLFKRGCVWNGNLSLHGSGSKDAPVVIGMYGEEGAKPLLNGCGEVMATVSAMDFSYLTIRNLEITNYSEKVTDYRRGISIMSHEGPIAGITIQNNYIHSVNSLATDGDEPALTSTREHGGIGIDTEILDWKFGDVACDGLLIENNRIERVVGSGIVTYGGVDNGAVRNNILNNVKGDCILLREFYNGVCEYNIAYSSGDNEQDYAYVNIWGISTRNTTFQYNESYDCLNYRDGQGYDLDNDCQNTLFQYNYSHDNLGGFILTCDYFLQHYGSVIRYNISENDGGTPFKICAPDKEENQTPGKTKYEIYNNTVYTSALLEEFIWVLEYTNDDGVLGNIYNNIFYIDGKEADFGVNASLGCFNYSNNCYYGFNDADILMLGDPNPITENPMLLAAGTAGVGRNNVDGYQLLQNSPCLKAGLLINNNGGRDYWGNPVSDSELPNLGAYEGEGVTYPNNFNYLAGKIGVASGYYGLDAFGHTPAYIRKLTDEKVSTAVSTNAVSEKEEAFFEFTFDQEVKLQSVVLTASKDATFFPKKYTVEVWRDGEWVVVAEGKNATGVESFETIVHDFEETATSKLRIVAKQLNGRDGEYRMELAEVSAFSTKKAE